MSKLYRIGVLTAWGSQNHVRLELRLGTCSKTSFNAVLSPVAGSEPPAWGKGPRKRSDRLKTALIGRRKSL